MENNFKNIVSLKFHHRNVYCMGIIMEIWFLTEVLVFESFILGVYTNEILIIK